MLNQLIEDHVRCMQNLQTIASSLEQAGKLLLSCLLDGGKVMACGNGGSASDAQHFTAEIVGRFEMERNAYPAVSLSTDTSILTALGNDYGYGEVFARQVQGLGQPNDVLIGISTSGSSRNVIRAVEQAKSMQIKSVGLLGRDGGPLKNLVDLPVVVENASTARIQEAHIFVLHYWAWMIESGLPQRPVTKA